MFNIRVFRIKDLMKYFAELMVVILIILCITKRLSQIKKNKEDQVAKLNENPINYDMTSCIDTTSGIIKSTNKPDEMEKKAYTTDFYEDVLKSQIGSTEDFEELDDSDSNTGISTTSDGITEENGNTTDSTEVAQTIGETGEQNTNVELAKTGLKTEVITQNPIALNYNVQYGNVKIKNGTSHELTQEMMNPNIDITNKNILIFHTHTCESYTSSEKFPYTPTGTYRTTDLNFSVARVGDELENHLKLYGYNVIHNKTYHDYPAYNGSYTRSLETVQNILKDNPTDIIFDVHRDAIGSRSDYAPIVKIGDEDIAAQIMFVIGSDEGGLWHVNWNQNLKFAIKVQQKAEEMYPGLFKPIMLTKYRYNQHSGKYASIIEVGSTGNTLEQCITSMKYLAKVLDEVMKE